MIIFFLSMITRRNSSYHIHTYIAFVERTIKFVHHFQRFCKICFIHCYPSLDIPHRRFQNYTRIRGATRISPPIKLSLTICVFFYLHLPLSYFFFFLFFLSPPTLTLPPSAPVKRIRTELRALCAQRSIRITILR